MITEALVRPSAYHDSVTLLGLAREMRGCPGVREAAALMATPANKALLAESGLLTAEAEQAGPNTGIAGRIPGTGQIGAGVVRAPLGCFEQALEALAAARLTS